MEIDIVYKGQELTLPVELMKWGYTYRVVIEVNGTQVFFEPDEEGSYRAVIEDGTANVDAELLGVIVAQLVSIKG